MYYLQSRYYNSDIARFINADIPEYAIFSISSTHNIFTYCLNNPIHFTDSTGKIVGIDDAAVLSLIALCGLIFISISMPKFIKMWSDFCAAVTNGLSWIAHHIVNGTKTIWRWSKKQVKAAYANLNAFLTIARAESKISSKVKKNSKERYWAASIKNISGYTYVEISSAISYSTAKSRVALGLCVFTVTKSEARQLASNFPPIVGPEKGAKDSGQYMHYHVRGRVNKSHIFFLF